MSANPVEQPKAQAVFVGLQSAVEKLVAETFPGPAAPVSFHREPSRHFFVYRKIRPSLRLDVELADDFQSIRFATGTSESRFGFRVIAAGEVRLFHNQKLWTPEEAAKLLLASFLS
jgi:hypothetical protein